MSRRQGNVRKLGGTVLDACRTNGTTVLHGSHLRSDDMITLHDRLQLHNVKPFHFKHARYLDDSVGKVFGRLDGPIAFFCALSFP